MERSNAHDERFVPHQGVADRTCRCYCWSAAHAENRVNESKKANEQTINDEDLPDTVAIACQPAKETREQKGSELPNLTFPYLIPVYFPLRYLSTIGETCSILLKPL